MNCIDHSVTFTLNLSPMRYDRLTPLTSLQSSELNPCPLFWESLPRLSSHGDLTSYQAKQKIDLPPNELFLICRGILQLVTSHPNGNETVLGLAASTSLIGIPLTKVNPYWAVALTDVLLLPLSWADIEASPLLAGVLFQNILQRLQQSETWLAIAGKRQVEDRLRYMLLLLAQEFGESLDSQTIELKLCWTHQQLANAIGSTRVTVSRLIHQFKAEGWLNNQYRRWSIRSVMLQQYLDSAA